MIGFVGNAQFDEIALYPTALTPTAIAQRYVVGTQSPPLQPRVQVMGISICRPACKTTPSLLADPVNSATGGLDHAVTDLAVPGRGESLTLTRNYDSVQTAGSTLGIGWWYSYFQSVALVAGTGALQWRTGGGALVTFAPNGTGGFTVPPGIIATASVAGWSKPLIPELGWLVRRRCGSGLGGLGWVCGVRG